MSAHIFHQNQTTITALSQRSNHKNGFYRVTKHRLCRICRKPDWCGYTVDEQTSICMRISNGSKGTSRNGGNIFHHNRLYLVARPQLARKEALPPIEIAPIEIRSAVYEELIRRSPAVQYYSQLIDGAGGLLLRGMRESDTQNYGALPRTQKERAVLAKTLNKFLKARFPEYVGRINHPAIIGVPGFWQDGVGNIQLWSPRDYNIPSLIIPYRDDEGRIQACQLRLHPNDLCRGAKKYRWLACPFPFRGASSGTPIHFTFKPADLLPGKTVIITEGALKADVLVSLRPNARVIATSGVSCAHSELIGAVRPYNVLIAFDADYKTNAAVAQQLARLIAARERDALAHELSMSTQVVTWERYKGIDDAVLAGVELKIVTISQWISMLDDRLRVEIWRAVAQIKRPPTPFFMFRPRVNDSVL